MDMEDLRHVNQEGFARMDRAAELEGEIVTLASRIHAATFRLLEMLREFEELSGWNGWPTPAHWLQWRCGYSLGAAREKFRVARALPGLPLIREAFRSGGLSFAQVRAVTRIATPENEARLLMWAQHATASQMERFVRLYRRHGENTAALEHHRERSFTWFEDDDGMVSMKIRLPRDQAEVVLKAIEAARASLDGQDIEDLPVDEQMVRRGLTGHAGEPAGLGQPADKRVAAETPEDVSAETSRARSADALVRLAQAYLEPGLRPRSLAEQYQVHVHLDLRKGADGPIQDPDAPPLAQETIRRLGCEAALIGVLHRGDEILSVGRRTRAVPPAIRRALRLRDRGCRFPGCTHTRHVDAHHIRHWADGGETKLSNLVELCGRHHRLLHEGGYGLKVTDDGALVFTRPDGERIPDLPRPFELTATDADPLHDVAAETFRCQWDGRPPDYGTMVELMDASRRPLPPT
jgi:hypothetical protein